jgi:hypothetical protein
MDESSSSSLKEGFLELPSQAYLKEIFIYDPLTGELRWDFRKDQSNSWNGRFARQIAGSQDPKTGVLRVGINGTLYLVSRVIWKIMTGEDPQKLVDHRDGDPGNNRWGNLRLATHAQNGANKAGWSSRDLPKCVYPRTCKSGIRYGVIISNKQIGTFGSIEAAVEARNEHLLSLYGAFARCA